MTHLFNPVQKGFLTFVLLLLAGTFSHPLTGELTSEIDDSVCRLIYHANAGTDETFAVKRKIY